MPSFQISISPSRRAAARFINQVRRAIQKALVEEGEKTGINQSEIARRVGTHRSVINRELNGEADLTLGRVAEIAHALGRSPHFELRSRENGGGGNSVKVQIKTKYSSSANEVERKNKNTVVL